MPPVFVDPGTENEERLATKQTREPTKPRKFGTNITNTYHARPQFSEKKQAPRTGSPPATRPAKRLKFNEKSYYKPLKATNATQYSQKDRPVRFFAEKHEVYDIPEDVPESPPLRLARGSPSLGSLIRTRSLELQTREIPSSQVVDKPQDLHAWNGKTALSPEFVVLNPHRCPLDRAKFVKYTDKVLIAG